MRPTTEVMDPVASTASTSGTTSTSTESTTKSTEKKSEDSSKTSFSTLFAAAKQDLKDGESIKRVGDHHYAKISGGARAGEYVNLTGNARNGEAFSLVQRAGHTFHVYGTGKDRVVVELKGAGTGGTQAKS